VLFGPVCTKWEMLFVLCVSRYMNSEMLLVACWYICAN